MLQINDTIKLKKSKTKSSLFLRLKETSLSSALLSIMIIVVMILILVNPSRYAKSVTGGLKLFFTAVLPGLLPFMFLCKILTEIDFFSKLSKPLNKPMQRFFGVGGYGFYAFLMSIISGYPLGSKITADLYSNGLLSKNEITKTAIISSSSGLEFIVGVVGGLMFKSVKIGIIIYVSNILAVLIASLFIHLFSNKAHNTENTTLVNNTASNKTKSQPNILKIFTNSAVDTSVGLLTVCFYIAIFSLVIDLLNDIKILSFISNILSFSTPHKELVSGSLSGIIEMTNGIKIISQNITPTSTACASMLISFGGLSIIMQSLSFLSSVPIKKGLFFLGKILQAILSFFICLIFSLLFL